MLKYIEYAKFRFFRWIKKKSHRIFGILGEVFSFGNFAWSACFFPTSCYQSFCHNLPQFVVVTQNTNIRNSSQTFSSTRKPTLLAIQANRDCLHFSHTRLPNAVAIEVYLLLARCTFPLAVNLYIEYTQSPLWTKNATHICILPLYL